MVQQTLELLPYEFARLNRVLLQADLGNLMLAPGAPDWAIAEVSRAAASRLTVSRVGDEDFDAMLSQVYSGRQGSSESVMEDIKDFVDLESAAARLKRLGICSMRKMMLLSSACSMPFWPNPLKKMHLIFILSPTRKRRLCVFVSMVF